jgi:hypothetical protein
MRPRSIDGGPPTVSDPGVLTIGVDSVPDNPRSLPRGLHGRTLKTDVGVLEERVQEIEERWQRE